MLELYLSKLYIVTPLSVSSPEQRIDSLLPGL
jgi:hypothetical protein